MLRACVHKHASLHCYIYTSVFTCIDKNHARENVTKLKNTPTLYRWKKQYYCISYTKSDFQACSEVQGKPLRIKNNYLAVTMKNYIHIVKKIHKFIFRNTTTLYRALSALIGKLLCLWYQLLLQHCRSKFGKAT